MRAVAAIYAYEHLAGTVVAAAASTVEKLLMLANSKRAGNMLVLNDLGIIYSAFRSYRDARGTVTL